MRILFIGDVVGKPGRRSVARWLPELRTEFALDFVIANAENSAGGVGATPDTLAELTRAGVDAFTMGNHTWRKKAIFEALDTMPNIVRPANYPQGVPGKGVVLIPAPGGRSIGLVNVLGRVYMEAFACPFETAREAVDAVRRQTPLVVVDVHAEATSEKIALGWYLDSRCTAVIGTHTHVQTADERVLPGGTAYITDVGMTGPFDSVIGSSRDAVLKKFVTGMPSPFTVADDRPGLNAVCIEADDETGNALSITRIQRYDESPQVRSSGD